MSEPDEPDQISRELDAIIAEYFAPPTEMDLRGVDPSSFALGLSYGFDSWQLVRVAANNRRNVATAERHWAEHHPSREFLRHVVGTDERALGHRQLLDRAHPRCAECEEQLRQLSAVNLDRVDPDGPPDDIDLDWLLFQPVHVTRSENDGLDASSLLHVPDRGEDQPITAEYDGGNGWQVTVRHPSARRATVRIRWTSGHVTEHAVIFENDLADIDVEAPEAGGRPASVGVRVTEPPEPP
jgi:hypothetical protein